MPYFLLWVLSLFGYIYSGMAAYHRERRSAIIGSLAWLVFPFRLVLDTWNSGFDITTLEFLPMATAGLFFGIVLFPGMVLSESLCRRTKKQREEAAGCMSVPMSLGIVVLFLCGYTLWTADKLGAVV